MVHAQPVLVAVFAALLLLSQPLAAAQRIDDFTRLPRYDTARLSPDGKKLGIIVIEEGKRVLALLTLDPLEFTYVLRFSENQEVLDFRWANKDRVLVDIIKRYGMFEAPTTEGLIYAINYDGKRGDLVFGWSPGELQTGSRIRKREQFFGHATVISLMPGKRSDVLISTHPWTPNPLGSSYSYRGDRVGEVHRLNIYNGRTREVVSHPGFGGRAYADDAGTVHFGLSLEDNGASRLHRRQENQWVALPFDEHRYTVPVGIDERYAWLLSDDKGDTRGLVRMDLESGEITEIFRDPRVDIEAVEHYPGTQTPMSLRLEDGRSRHHFLDPGRDFAPFYRGIIKAFDGFRVELASVTADGELALVRVSGDTVAGDFYLANRKTRQIRFLLSSTDWLEADSLATTEVLELEARDGLPLQGYLTFPAGVRKNLPTVVLPHGGPSIRDYWEFDREAQLLAANGYLVLRINFRGSDGYGRAFREASSRQWGKAVQDDISDALRAIIDRGYADAGRVCIYGASFGAYSAMMSAIREPGLYRCAAGYAGVYDLEMMYTEGDIPLTRPGQAYLESELGTASELLQAQSPVHQANKLTLPLFYRTRGKRPAGASRARSRAGGSRAGERRRSQHLFPPNRGARLLHAPGKPGTLQRPARFPRSATRPGLTLRGVSA